MGRAAPALPGPEGEGASPGPPDRAGLPGKAGIPPASPDYPASPDNPEIPELMASPDYPASLERMGLSGFPTVSVPSGPAWQLILILRLSVPSPALFLLVPLF